ncbi:hypothetical protein [Microbacterium aureliae]
MFVNDPDHPSFSNHPEDSESVWRYMDLARYLSLLQTSALHFARSDQMSDRWEGAIGQLNVERRSALYGEDFAAMYANSGLKRANIMRLIHMNCWHLSEVESAAMWDIYQREGRGVALKSNWGLLKGSITSNRSVYGAKVEYVDYRSTLIPEGIVFDAFLHKRESFSHEREVRLVMLAGGDDDELGDELDDRNDEESDEGRPLTSVDEPVIPVSVDLPTLVERVYVAPDAPSWITEVVEAVTRQYGLAYPVQQSDLASDPIE